MAHRGSHNGVVVGAIVGLLLSFRIVVVIVLGIIAYFCFAVVYDGVISKAKAPEGSWSFQVVGETTPDFHFSRENPSWTIETEMTNKGSIKISGWTLRGKLYECPRAFAPLDTCTKVGETAKRVGGIVLPGETHGFQTVMDFWDNDDTVGQVRAIWSVEDVTTDNDTQADKSQRLMEEQLARLNSYK